MDEDLPVRRVEVSFVGAAPARQVERATGVSGAEIDGSILRCLVCGSFQPFLEALRGHEVVGFNSTLPPGPAGDLPAPHRPGQPKKDPVMRSPRTLARTAGSLYLIMFMCALFAGQVRSRIVDPGDAAATAGNIRASATLFRAGFVSDLVQVTSMLLVAMALYLLLKHIHRLAAAAMVTFVAVAVAIGCLNLLNQYTALTIATGQDYTRAFGRPASDALTLLFTGMQNNGYYISAIFWGLWLLPLGYLVISSGYVPKLLGVLLIIGGAGYLADLFTRFLVSSSAPGISLFVIPGMIAEFLFMAWLLVKGVKVPAAPHARVPALATPTAHNP
jgi:hypothetical protein